MYEVLNYSLCHVNSSNKRNHIKVGIGRFRSPVFRFHRLINNINFDIICLFIVLLIVI